MSYYYFGEEKTQEQEENRRSAKEKAERFPILRGSLVIEEDTIYEIDEQCLRGQCCQKK